MTRTMSMLSQLCGPGLLADRFNALTITSIGSGSLTWLLGLMLPKDELMSGR